jgi:hypothetical protein
LITDKSEWQSPAPMTFTSISFSSGGAILISSIDNGLDILYGSLKVLSLMTAALHVIVI